MKWRVDSEVCCECSYEHDWERKVLQEMERRFGSFWRDIANATTHNAVLTAYGELIRKRRQDHAGPCIMISGSYYCKKHVQEILDAF